MAGLSSIYLKKEKKADSFVRYALLSYVYFMGANVWFATCYSTKLTGSVDWKQKFKLRVFLYNYASRYQKRKLL